MQAAVLLTGYPSVLAHRVLGSSLMFRGEFDAALAQFNDFQAIYDPDTHEAELGKVGATGHACTVKLCLAEIHTIKGESEKSALWQRAALVAAQTSAHVQTQCQTVAFAGGFVYALMRDAAGLRLHGAELKRLSGHYDMPLWQPQADLLEGLAGIRAGDVEAGFALARSGVRTLIASSVYLLSTWCVVYADVC